MARVPLPNRPARLDLFPLLAGPSPPRHSHNRTPPFAAALRLATDVVAKFAASSWGKKLAGQKAKAAMTDFDRYKAAVVKAKKARAVRKVFNQLKKAAK